MILNGRVINPGDLRTKILLAPRSVSMETGFQATAPDTAHQVEAWARWENAHGAEVWQAAALQALEPATVLVRYQTGIDRTWYASKDAGASWFEVVSLDDIQERHEYIELKVQRWREG